MTRTYRYVNKVGVELEGGWDNPPFDIGHDGSVNVNAQCVGEIASKPLLPSEVAEWMTTHYPQAVNETCGLHVHVSVKQQVHYAKLMDPKFEAYFLKAMKDWGTEAKVIKEHPFWKRLTGDNQYCQKKFVPEKQIFAKQKGGAERYTQLNFCYSLHGTMECRMLPAFKKPVTGVAAVMAIVDCVENYLRENKGSMKKITVKVTDTDLERDNPAAPVEEADASFVDPTDLDYEDAARPAV